MTFISIDYLFVFVPIVVGLYYVFRTSYVANIIILGASYYFYAATTQWYLIPLVITSLLDFAVGILLSRSDHAGYRRGLLVLSLSANLGLLAFFKYTPWLINNVNFGTRSRGGDIRNPRFGGRPAPWHLVLYLSDDELHDRGLSA